MAQFKRYFDAERPASYQGSNTFARQFKGLNRERAKIWLSKQDAYNLHRPVVRKFKRAKITTTGPNEQFEADLIDLSNIKSHNKGNTFLLVVIDVFSRRASVCPLKSKQGRDVAAALELIFDKWTNPKYLRTDQGKEFKNAQVQKVLKDRKIKYFTTYGSEVKAAICERFNRTLLSKLFKYFTKNKTKTYLDVLPKLVKSYNDTYHASVGTAPNLVTKDNYEAVWLRLYNQPVVYKKPQFSVGDHVRVSKARKTFDKGYLPRWSQELFKVHKIKKTNPTSYILKDLQGEKIAGAFYEREMIKAKKPTFWNIETILDTKKTKKGIEYFVKWEGYPAKFNSWTTQLKLT